MSINSINRRNTIGIILVTMTIIGYVAYIITNKYCTEIKALTPEELDQLRPGGINVKPILIIISAIVLVLAVLPAPLTVLKGSNPMDSVDDKP